MKKWTKKVSDYGTSGFFISPYYGEDLAIAPDYDEVSNPFGYGGPKHPLKSLEKSYQEGGSVHIIDSSSTTINSSLGGTIVGDGSVLLISTVAASLRLINLTFITSFGLTNAGITENCTLIGLINYYQALRIEKCVVINSNLSGELLGGYKDYNTYINTRILLQSVSNAYSLVNDIYIEDSVTSPLISHSYGDRFTDFNIISESRGITYNGTAYASLSEAKENGVMLKSFDLEDLGLKTNLEEADNHADNVDDWRKLFNNAIDVSAQNFMYADFSISSQLHQRIYDNQITNHGKTHEEAETIAYNGVNKVMYGGRYGGYIGAKPMATRIDADALWNTYKDVSTNLEYTSGNLITTDNTQVGTYESLDIPFGKKIVVENGSLANEVAYQLKGWVDARVSADDYETIDNTVEQRTVMVYELDFYQDPNEDNTGSWTGFKRFEVNAPLRIDNAGNGNQDAGYDDTQAQVIHDVTKFKLRFEMRKVACGVHPDKPCI